MFRNFLNIFEIKHSTSPHYRADSDLSSDSDMLSEKSSEDEGSVQDSYESHAQEIDKGFSNISRCNTTGTEDTEETIDGYDFTSNEISKKDNAYLNKYQTNETILETETYDEEGFSTSDCDDDQENDEDEILLKASDLEFNKKHSKYGGKISKFKVLRHFSIPNLKSKKNKLCIVSVSFIFTICFLVLVKENPTMQRTIGFGAAYKFAKRNKKNQEEMDKNMKFAFGLKSWDQESIEINAGNWEAAYKTIAAVDDDSFLKSPGSTENSIFLNGETERCHFIPKKEHGSIFSKPVLSSETPYFIRPYNCYGEENCPEKWEKLYNTRNDILWVDYDMGNYKINQDGKALVGVTIPPNIYYQGPDWDPSIRSTNILNFRGRCHEESNGFFNSENHRSHLKYLSEVSIPQAGVKIECIKSDDVINDSIKEQNYARFTRLLASSNFTLIPHGTERWSYRFIEAVGACTIPVIIADGLTLPYEQVIDWTDVVIRISESDFLNMKSLDELIAQLPNDPIEIIKKRLRICELNDVYFRTPEARKNGLYLSALMWTRRKKSKLKFKNINNNCRDPLRMCENNVEP